MSRFRPAKQAPSAPMRRVLGSIQDAETIRRYLDAGAVETPIGPQTVLRVDINRWGKFPTELVEQVKRARAEVQS